LDPLDPDPHDTTHDDLREDGSNQQDDARRPIESQSQSERAQSAADESHDKQPLTKNQTSKSKSKQAKQQQQQKKSTQHHFYPKKNRH
jgi:hypothetical protein